MTISAVTVIRKAPGMWLRNRQLGASASPVRFGRADFLGIDDRAAEKWLWKTLQASRFHGAA